MSLQTQISFNIIGIDVSKDKLDIYIFNTQKPSVIKNNKADIKNHIKKVLPEMKEVLIVMENTGGYEILARTLFNEAGYHVHIAHANRIHHFAKQKGFFAKTDAIDAKIIAEYGVQEKVQPSKPRSKQAVELKELSTRRAQLIDVLTAEKCRLKPHQSVEMNRSIERSIKCLETEIALLDKKITQRVSENTELHEKAQRIQTVKGLGKITANVLVSLLPELGSLNRAEIASLCGLAPKNNDSGTKTGRRHINGGRFQIRKALYMAAVCACTHNIKMSAYYQHLQGKGKESKVAITAVMRKIIITLNAMIRDKKDWCYE
jgi:transposase